MLTAQRFQPKLSTRFEVSLLVGRSSRRLDSRYTLEGCVAGTLYGPNMQETMRIPVQLNLEDFCEQT